MFTGALQSTSDHRVSLHRDVSKAMMSRTEIEQFCRGFLLDGDYQHLHRIVAEYDEKLACINIEFTASNFNSTFQQICKNLFATRSVTAGYVLAVLAFAVNIDNRLKHSSSWYSSDVMIVSLTSVLVDVNFNPSRVAAAGSFCTLL